MGATRDAEISTTSGSVGIDDATGAVQVRSVSGTVVVGSAARGPVNASSVTGTITIHLPPDVRPAVRSSGPGKVQNGFEAESSSTGLPLWIRVGMHHGTALQRGSDVIGHDVNVAARIVDIAAPGEVPVSDAVRAGVEPRSAHVCFTELGPVVMKGIPGPIRLWRASPR